MPLSINDSIYIFPMKIDLASLPIENKTIEIILADGGNPLGKG